MRRVRRILISSKDVTGVASEKSDAVKFASQAKLRWRKTWKWREQSHMLLTKQYYALYVVNKWSHSGSKVVPKMFKSVQQFVTKWKQSYLIHLSLRPSGPKSVTKWSRRSHKVINHHKVRIWSSSGALWTQGSQMVVPKKSSSGPQLVVTEPLLAFLIWSQVVLNWSC